MTDKELWRQMENLANEEKSLEREEEDPKTQKRLQALRNELSKSREK